jgi:hypothetical protein
MHTIRAWGAVLLLAVTAGLADDLVAQTSADHAAFARVAAHLSMPYAADGFVRTPANAAAPAHTPRLTLPARRSRHSRST